MYFCINYVLSAAVVVSMKKKRKQNPLHALYTQKLVLRPGKFTR